MHFIEPTLKPKKLTEREKKFDGSKNEGELAISVPKLIFLST